MDLERGLNRDQLQNEHLIAAVNAAQDAFVTFISDAAQIYIGAGAAYLGYKTYGSYKKRPRDIQEAPAKNKRVHKEIMPKFGTVQRDVKGLYRKRKRRRRMRRGRRRKYRRRGTRKLINKVRNAIYKDLGEYNYNLNEDIQNTSVAAAQEIVAVPFCGWYGSTGSGNQDMFEMVQSMLATNPDLKWVTPNTINPSNAANLACRMRKAVIDITVTNTGTSSIEMDIYETYVKKDILFGTWNLFVAQLLLDMQSASNIPNTGNLSKITGTTLGVTPFDISGHGTSVKIFNVTRIYLEPGKSTSFLRKGRYRKQVKESDFSLPTNTSQNQWFGKAGLTKIYLFKYSGCPTSASIAPSAGIRLNINKHYSFNILQNQQNYSAFIP